MGVAQANYELLRLVNTLDAHATGTLEVSQDDLVERFDIFWSRLPLLVEGPDGNRIAEISDSATIVPGLRDRLAQLEPDLLALEPGDRQAQLRLREELLTFHPSLHRLFVQANQNYVFETSRRNQQISELYRHHRLYQSGILISAGVFVLLLFREIRSVRNAQQEAIAARNQLGTVIDAVPVMISMVDRNGRYLLMNRHQRESCGSKSLRRPAGRKQFPWTPTAIGSIDACSRCASPWRPTSKPAAIRTVASAPG